LIYLIYACEILPLLLLAIEWSRSTGQPIELSILTLSAVLYLAADVRTLKLTLLGGDYSNRLFIAIGINMLVAIALGGYIGSKGRWLAMVAGAILAVGWLLMWAINTAV
jgi:hypothetical protein